MIDVGFSCDCGEVQGVLHDVTPKAGCHLICYCKDCRAFARRLGQADALEPGGGSPLVQVLPARIEVTKGASHIACLRMSEKGLHRWYAACCKTPLANTTGSPRLPLAGMWRPNFQVLEPFGPVVTHGFTKMAMPGGPPKDKGLLRMLGGLLKRTVSAYLTGKVRQNPFFNQDGTPIVAPTILTAAERTASYKE